MTFKTYFKDKSSHPNIVHVACNNLSQVHVTQTLRPKNAVIFSPLIPMILKIDMFPWWLPYLPGGCPIWLVAARGTENLKPSNIIGF